MSGPAAQQVHGAVGDVRTTHEGEYQNATSCHRLRQGPHGAVQVGLGVQGTEEGVDQVELLTGKDPREVLGTAAFDPHRAVGEFGARQLHHARRDVDPRVAPSGIACGEPGEIGARAAAQIQHRGGRVRLDGATECLAHPHQHVVRAVAFLCHRREGIVVSAGLAEIALVGAQGRHARIILV